MAGLGTWNSDNNVEGVDQVTFQYNFTSFDVPTVEETDDTIKFPSGGGFMAYTLNDLEAHDRIGSISRGDYTERQKIAEIMVRQKASVQAAAAQLAPLGAYRPNKLAIGHNPHKRSERIEFNVVITFVRDDLPRYKAKQINRYFMAVGRERAPEGTQIFLNHDAEIELNFHLTIHPATAVENRRYLPYTLLDEAIQDVNNKMTEALSPQGLLSRMPAISPRFQAEVAGPLGIAAPVAPVAAAAPAVPAAGAGIGAAPDGEEAGAGDALPLFAGVFRTPGARPFNRDGRGIDAESWR